MPIDREDILKKAEKLLRQGRLDAAIVEYLRVVEEQPRDWATANTLGDLYVRAGQTDKAAVQYGRVAEHFQEEGFYPKAAALYKKLLKFHPEDEAAQLNLAEISQKQGLLADAKAHLNAVAGRRRNRGDRAGAAEIVVRLGSIDPADFEARTTAARTLKETGDEEGAAERYRSLYDDLLEKGRRDEALAALREVAALNPYDQSARVMLAKAAIETGDVDGARTFLDRETAGGDPSLQMALLEIDLKSGHLDEARELLPSLLARGPDERHQIVDLAWSTAESNAEAAFVVIEAAVDYASSTRDYDDAASMLQEFVTRLPNQIPALLKLIEVCVDGGLEATMNEAQAQLADAYLGAGQAAEARVIAEDLVAREPWERAHIDRFRRALVILKVPDPDMLIAERLSGQAPFTATDLFAESPTSEMSQPVSEPVSDEASLSEGEAIAQPVAVSEAGTAQLVTERVGPRETRASSDETDLTTELGDLHGGSAVEERPASKPENLGEVFQDFREEVTRQTGADQSAQHMTLARTYLEMGMPDEAIASLTNASKSPPFRFEAASRLGRIYAQRGDVTQAIEWFERAAEAPAPNVEEGRALLYNLGALVEQSGDTSRALAIFLELQSDAGDYRDVAGRVERLARVETETGG